MTQPAAPIVRPAAAWTADDIAAILVDACGVRRIAALGPGPRSYSNRLWLADTDEGRLLVRVPGRTTDPAYVRASIVAARLAAEAGVPTVRFRAFLPVTALGLPVVVQEYRPGDSAAELAGRGAIDPAAVAAALGDWIGVLHGVRRAGHGGVLEAGGAWPEVAAGKVAAALDRVGAADLPDARPAIADAFARAIAALPDVGAASLVHGDLYLDNVLVADGRAAAVIDFEHAHFYDRFAELGKLEELVFGWWPGTAAPFLRAYHRHFPPAPGDGVRRRLGVGLYELGQLAYFARWQPDLVPVYRERLGRWLAAPAPSPQEV